MLVDDRRMSRIGRARPTSGRVELGPNLAPGLLDDLRLTRQRDPEIALAFPRASPPDRPAGNRVDAASQQPTPEAGVLQAFGPSEQRQDDLPETIGALR